jgi:hypothetical protein
MEQAKRFCDQCERRVSEAEAARCRQMFCRVKPEPVRRGIFPDPPKQNLKARNASRKREQDKQERLAAAQARLAPLATIDVFAEYLSHHDLTTRDTGGDVPKVAARMRIRTHYANALLQRIRKRLGSQAR